MSLIIRTASYHRHFGKGDVRPRRTRRLTKTADSIFFVPRFSGEPAKWGRPLEPLAEELRIVNWIAPEQTLGAVLAK
jgi:hypothetical protein